MSSEFESIGENLKKPANWIRALFVLGYCLLLNFIIIPIIVVLAVIQIFFSLIKSEPNENLVQLGGQINLYVVQILEFITYNSEITPFPFNDLPQYQANTPNSREQTEKQENTRDL